MLFIIKLFLEIREVRSTGASTEGTEVFYIAELDITSLCHKPFNYPVKSHAVIFTGLCQFFDTLHMFRGYIRKGFNNNRAIFQFDDNDIFG